MTWPVFAILISAWAIGMLNQIDGYLTQLFLIAAVAVVLINIAGGKKGVV